MAKQSHPPPLSSGGMKLMTATEMIVARVTTSVMIMMAMRIMFFVTMKRR